MENTAEEEVDMYSRIEAKTEEWLHSISKQFQYCSNGKKVRNSTELTYLILPQACYQTG